MKINIPKDMEHNFKELIEGLRNKPNWFEIDDYDNIIENIYRALSSENKITIED